MNTFSLLAALALSALATPALADNPHNNPPEQPSTNVTGGMVGVHVDGFSFDTSGSTDSTSGVSTDFSAEGNGMVGFASTGVAGAFATATPLSAASTTFHSATLVAGALGDASIDGNAASFGNANAEFATQGGALNLTFGFVGFSFED